MNRRDWLRATSLAAGAGLLGARDLRGLQPAEYERLARPLDGPARLHFNENPYGPSPAARAEMVKWWEESNRYFTGGSTALRRAVAAINGVPEDHVLATQGSAEGLCATAAAFTMGNGEMVHATPTYLSLISYSQHVGSRIVPVPLTGDLVHDLAAMEAAITPATRLVFVCNPNNPTGTIVPDAILRPWVERVSQRTLVFVDEAYHDYVEDPGYRSFIPMVKTNGSVIVSRTASKIHGMAGLRVGFLYAQPGILARIRDYQMGFPNAMALRAAVTAVQDTAYQDFVRARNRESKAIIYDALDRAGLRYVRSHTNFVFFRTGRPANEVAKAFEAKGVLVGRAFPPLGDWCRVSTGTPEETERFAKALPGVLA
jgi:histidinol-phosphate aminotransferase